MEKKKLNNKKCKLEQFKGALLGIIIVLLLVCIDYSNFGAKDILLIALVGINILLFLRNRVKHK